MDADRPLKKLFELRASDLLPVTGDPGARVLSRLVPEVAAVTRRLDFVLKLRRGSEVYLRHLEFEMRYRSGLADRVFDYGAALFAQHRLPVASTVIILKPPGPPSLLHEERVCGRTECRRRIRVVRLWRMSPASAMRMGVGGAALVGLTGRPDVRMVEAAARRIKAECAPTQLPDLWAVLRMLSEGRYTARELQRIVPREVAMESSLVAWVKRRSRADGLARGEVQNARAVCLDLVKQEHPAILRRVEPIIQACPDPQLLRKWTLAAPRSTPAEFMRMLREAPSPRRDAAASRTSRRRATMPSRRSKRLPRR